MENRSFYNEILTEHNVRPEFKHDLPDADIVLEGVNPSCGDDIFLKLKTDGDTIVDGAFVGDGCAISQASADIMLGMIVGKKKEEALQTEAYDEVFACFKLPKATDEEKAARSAAIQEATRHAALIPMEVARKALEVMPVIADIARLGNRNAITDACVAMMAARSAVLGALLNVRINLGVLKDKEFVLGLQAEADRMEQTACRKEKELLDAVNQDLRV